MARIFNPPEQLEVPVYDYKLSWDEYDKAETDWYKALFDWIKRQYPKDPRPEVQGKVLMFPQGDGNAVYMVASTEPVTLIHCPLGDAWRGDQELIELVSLDYVRRHAINIIPEEAPV